MNCETVNLLQNVAGSVFYNCTVLLLNKVEHQTNGSSPFLLSSKVTCQTSKAGKLEVKKGEWPSRSLMQT